MVVVIYWINKYLLFIYYFIYHKIHTLFLKTHVFLGFKARNAERIIILILKVSLLVGIANR